MQTILIIEDDKDINQLLYDTLSPIYHVIQSFDGRNALTLLQEQAFDLVITDLMLPGMSGEELIGLVKKIQAIPIIVITAKTNVDVLVDVLSLGADDYLAKPFNLKELTARIQVQLRKNQVTNRIEYKGFILNMNSYEVTYNNDVIMLLQKEFEIFKLFLLEPNKVHTKAAIYQSVWKETYYDDENTINVHMSRLRKKLSDCTNQECIQTVWGLGYKLVI